MRLILDAEIQPETVERLRALVARPRRRRRHAATRRSTPLTLADPEVEVLIGVAAAGRPGRRAAAALAPGPLGRRRPPRRRSAVAQGPARDQRQGRLRHPDRRVRQRDGPAHPPAGRDLEPPTRPPITGRERRRRLVSIVRGRTAVIAGYGSIGREVARQLSALGMRIIAVKPRPERPRATSSFRVPGHRRPGRLDPRADRRRRRRSPRSRREADVLVLTMPLTDASRGIIGRDGHRRAAAARLAHQRRARPARRRSRPCSRRSAPAAWPARSSTSSARSRCRPTARGGTRPTSSSRRTRRATRCGSSTSSSSRTSGATWPASRCSTRSTPSADTRSQEARPWTTSRNR